jgi:hypothetical protein
MSNVIAFPRRFRVICSEVTQAQADDLQSLLFETLQSCPACDGVGHFTHKHPAFGTIATSPCPCGGTDEDRVDLDRPDFGGVA